MAWPRDKQEIIEFIEDGIVETLYVAGYLEGIPDPQAVKCGEKIEIRIPWDEEGSLALVWTLIRLGIDVRFAADNRTGALLIYLDEEDDQAVLALWDELTDLRVRYIEARQAALVEQLSYLEGSDATTA